MPEIPRTKFNSPWNVANIEAALNDMTSAKGSSESLTAAMNAMRAEIDSLSGGVHLKGAVDYYADLPASPSEGDAYTVRYQGTSGTDPLGIEYAWATYQGTPQWIPIGVDPSVFAKQTEMGVVANAGAKNLLKVSVADAKANAGNTGFTWAGNIASKNHVNFKINSDLTIDVSSDTGYNASDTTIFYLTDGAGAYPNTILNGCPSGGSGTTYELRTATPVKSDYGSGVAISSDSATNVVIIIRSGWSGELTFKPMIRPAAISDTTYQPYARTNRELTVLTDEDRDALIELVDSGAKNKFNPASAWDSKTAHGITITRTGDTYSIESGTTQSGDNLFINMGYQANTNLIPAGDWVLSFDTPQQNVTLQVCWNNSLRESASFGDNLFFTVQENTTNSWFRILLRGSTDMTGTSFKIMLCPLVLWKISQAYQPYRPSWQGMWDAIQALQSGGNRALTMQTEQEER